MAKKRNKPNPPLTIYYQNVRGLNKKEKREEFQNNVRKNNYDVICLTETMLKSGFDNSLLFDDRYVVFRHDRNLQPTEQIPKPKKGGGGVLIAVKKELNPTLLTLPIGSELGEAEDLWVTITLANGKQKNICCAYIPGYRGIQMTSHLASLIENPTVLNNSILVGDYNIPKVNFNTENASDDLRKVKRKRFRDMARFILDEGLTQFNHLTNINNVVLDLVLSYLNLEVIPANPLVRIDVHHPPILIKLLEDDDSSSSNSVMVTKVPVEKKSALTVAERDDIFVERKQKKKVKVRIMIDSHNKRKENEEIYWEDIRILFAEKEADGVKKEERDKIAEESEKESERQEKEAERKEQEERKKEKAKRESERKIEEERVRIIAEKEAERKEQEETKKEKAKKESERKIKDERVRIIAEKEAERKEQEERTKEKAKKESERKIEEEKVRIIAEKEAERKEQEERKKEKAKKESERKIKEEREAQRKEQEKRDNFNDATHFAAKLIMGAVIGTTVVAGVGICLVSCPALIPALPAAGKTAVASTVVVREVAVATVGAVVALFALFKW